jgi:tRNA-splicing ligase RtcB
MSDFEFRSVEGGSPIKMWTHGVQVEEQALQQLDNVSRLPFIFKHVAAMPDVHWGMGATVGSVIATKGAIVPAAVGVDIGCGMIAAKTNLVASDLPDNLHAVRLGIEAAVPHGRTDNGGDNDRGAWGEPSPRVEAFARNSERMNEEFATITVKHPKLTRWAKRYPRHLGTLGTGNHFIELCLDDRDDVWVMLHSGSRGVGNAIGQYFIARAREHMQRYFINLPDADLAYLPDGTQDFKDYVEAVDWAQNYALANRYLMLEAVIEAVGAALGRAVVVSTEAVNCHHNYVAREHHFGQNVIVTRKGAVRAREGDLGIIPGSMGTGSFIVRGKGNPDSFASCSHGAGRAMSRGEAKRRITLEDHAKAMAGIEARLDADVIDESPAAYKPINAVMEAQQSLVEIVHRLRQIVNVKG